MNAEDYLDAVFSKYAGHEFSSTQLPLPAEIVSTVRAIAKDIKPDDLIKAQNPNDIHITLKYGLHGPDPQPVRSVLGGEKAIHVRLGKTNFFPSTETDGKYDVVKVEVFSPDLRRLNRKIVGLLPHTTTHPHFQPHITVAKVKKGSGHKYAGRSDLEGKTLTLELVQFSNRAGHKTDIGLAKASGVVWRPQQRMQDAYQQYRGHVPSMVGFGGPMRTAVSSAAMAPEIAQSARRATMWDRLRRSGTWGYPSGGQSYMRSAPALMGAGAIGGGALGGLVAAPILAKIFGLDPRRARAVFGALGLGGGMLPGLIHGLAMKKLKGSFSAPWGPPRTPEEMYRHAKWTIGKPRFPFPLWDSPKPDTRTSRQRVQEMGKLLDNDYLREAGGNKEIWKQSSDSPDVWPDYLWNPSFPVAQSIDEVTNNAAIPPMQKAKMRLLIAEAGRQQGVGRSGMASAGSLISALPNVVGHAVPTVGGAWAVSKMLGAPRWLKRTTIGGALIHAALRGFMEKGASSIPVDDVKASPWMTRAWKAYDDPDRKVDGGMSVPMQPYQWRGQDRLKRQVVNQEKSAEAGEYLLAIVDGVYALEN